MDNDELLALVMELARSNAKHKAELLALEAIQIAMREVLIDGMSRDSGTSKSDALKAISSHAELIADATLAGLADDSQALASDMRAEVFRHLRLLSQPVPETDDEPPER